MQKVFLTIHRLLFYTIVLLALAQILLGAAWTLSNLGGLQGFRETEELLQVADNLVTDEYVGILYPLLIRFVRLLGRILPVPYYTMLYAAQLAVGFFALMKMLEGFPHRLWLALAVMTIPTVNQFYLAVLPQSLAASALLLCCFYCRKGSLPKGAVCWLAAGLLLPEYFWFCGVVFAVGMIGHWRKEKGFWRKEGVWGLLCILLVCLAAGTVNGLTAERYRFGRMARTPEAAILRRFVWPHFSDTYFFWREEIKEVFTEQDMVEISRNPDGPLYRFGPELEQVYGLRTAREYYLDMAKVTLRVRTKEVFKEVGTDFAMYCVPPVSLVSSLKGKGVSYSGWNYGRMSARSRRLTRIYVFYSCNGFVVVLFLSFCCWLAGLMARKKAESALKPPSGKRRHRYDGVLPLLSLGMILWYTLSGAGVQDYKNVIPVSMCWGLLMAEVLFGRRRHSAEEWMVPLK